MAMFLSRIKKVLNLGTKSITANGTYNASTDGYDGYSQVSVNVPQITPTSITPSNATPAALTANTPVTPTANGYAIESYRNVNPSSMPQGYPIGAHVGDIIRIITNDGYIIRRYSEPEPSDTNPPELLARTVYLPLYGGYLYASKQPKVKKGTFTTSGSSITEFTVDVGFQPDTIIVFFNGASGSMTGSSAANGAVRYIYDKGTNETYGFRAYRSTSSSMTVNMAEVAATGDTRVSSITATGFVWRNAADTKWNGTHTYIAIKW